MAPAGPVLQSIRVACAIVGGGPAGMMLGLLLARAGVAVAVLEKHADFLRDFRGDTIHPSTLEVIHELGLLDRFLQRPHTEVRRLTAQIGNAAVTLADFSRLPTHCNFIALMPQWDFLDFLAEHARSYPEFQLRMEAPVTDLLRAEERIVGVRADTADGPLEVRADLVVGADGRHSLVRAKAGLNIDDLGAPMDVLWLRIAKRSGDPAQPLGRIGAGRLFVMLDRGSYWQCAYVIAKGGYEEIRQRGLEALRADIARLVPDLSGRLEQELDAWNEIKLLTVSVDRLRQWYAPGLLCIGDAAHAMSPIGGVGINLAIQDAVAAANLLAPPLLAHGVTTHHLHQVQHRREWPARMTQRLQIFLQNRVIRRVLASSAPPSPPLPIRILNRCTILQRIPARLVGVGFRPEHVQVKAAQRV